MDALVLSGGGAYGAYEVGVMKALFEGRVRAAGGAPDAGIFTGTSVGAFNAAFMAMQSDADGLTAVGRLERIWVEKIAQQSLGAGNGVLRFRADPMPYLNPVSVAAHPGRSITGLVRDTMVLAQYGFDRGTAFFSSRHGIASRAMELVDLASLISVEPLRQTIAREISCERIQASPKQLRIVATDWEHGLYRVFAGPEVTREVILASASIPGVFPPVRFQNSTYVDGGVTMNTPLKPAIEAGAGTIHVISLDARLHPVPASELDCTLEALLRTFTIALSTAIREDMASASWINRGIEALERAAGGAELTSGELRDFVRVAAQLEQRAKQEIGLRRIAIHHYHPREALGGPAGLLDFRREVIAEWIARGSADAIAHDCRESGCVLPQPAPPAAE
jgi:predicted acylesterase/phospholipase RssA